MGRDRPVGIQGNLVTLLVSPNICGISDIWKKKTEENGPE